MTKQHPDDIKAIETNDLEKTTGGWGGPPPGYWAAREAYYAGYGGPGYGGPGWGGPGPGWGHGYSHGYRYWY